MIARNSDWSRHKYPENDENSKPVPKEKKQSIIFLHVKIERKNYDSDKIDDLVRKSVEMMQFWNF